MLREINSKATTPACGLQNPGASCHVNPWIQVTLTPYILSLFLSDFLIIPNFLFLSRSFTIRC
jgi:hypothetical protein